MSPIRIHSASLGELAGHWSRRGRALTRKPCPPARTVRRMTHLLRCDVLAEDNGPVTMNGSKQLVPRGAVHNAGVPVERVHGDRCRPENDVGSAARSLDVVEEEEEDVEPDGDPGGDPMMMYSASVRKPAKH